MEQNELINAMSDKDLEKFAKQYAGNEKITTYIDQIIKVRQAEAEAVKVKTEFEAKVKALANLPKPPEGILNVFLAWREVDDTTKPEIVTLPDKTTVTRFPKVWSWIVETNHADKVGRETGSTDKAGATKRAITVYQRDGTKLVFVGNYSAGSKACVDLKVDAGEGSANLALSKAGYIVTAYDTKALADTGLSPTIKS